MTERELDLLKKRVADAVLAFWIDERSSFVGKQDLTIALSVACRDLYRASGGDESIISRNAPQVDISGTRRWPDGT